MAITLHNLKSCIESYEERVAKLLKQLNWTENGTLEECKKICVPKQKITKNKSSTEDKHDPEYPLNVANKNFVQFDSGSLNKILNIGSEKYSVNTLPDRFSDFQVNFNREQKLALYNSVIDKTGRLTEPELLVVANKEDESTSSKGHAKKMTFAEIFALRRDLKRRRLKYRTTNTGPTTVTEELRNLIEIQMQALSQYLDSTNDKTDTIKKSSSERIKSKDRPSERSKTDEEYKKSEKHNKHHHKSPSKKHKRKRSRSRSHTREHNPSKHKKNHKKKKHS